MTHPAITRMDAERLDWLSSEALLAADALAETGTFQTGQTILRQCAEALVEVCRQRDQARAALAAQIARIKAIDATTSAVGPDDEYGKGAKWILAEVLALIEGDGE